MKRAVILHAFEQDSKGHWYPWLKRELEDKGYTVWVPDLPGKTAARATTNFLLSNSEWDFTDNLVIGHSMGAVQMFHLLQNLPENQTVGTAVFVSAFTKAITGKFDWAQPLQGLFEEPFNFEIIKTKAKKFLFVHGDNDPYCDPKDAQWLAEQVGVEFVLIKGGQHFSTSLQPEYTAFPRLIKLLDERSFL